MKNLFPTILVTLTTLSASALAQSAPGAPAPAPAPVAGAAGGTGPANETANPNDLSSINGQLVPIGDHNQYHYDFKRWNISANPIGWMIGFYGASLSYAVSQNVAIRGDLNLFAPPGVGESKGEEIGIGAPIYFRRTYQGVFLEPGFIARHINYGGGVTSNTAGPQVLVGWHWTWDSGLNVAAAFGAGRNWSSHDGTSSYDDSKVFVNGYLRFGYAF